MNLATAQQYSKHRHTKEGNKETWLPASWIYKFTHWTNGNELRSARDRGWVIYRGKGKSMQYLLESIKPIFLKNQQNQTL